MYCFNFSYIFLYLKNYILPNNMQNSFVFITIDNNIIPYVWLHNFFFLLNIIWGLYLCCYIKFINLRKFNYMNMPPFLYLSVWFLIVYLGCYQFGVITSRTAVKICKNFSNISSCKQNCWVIDMYIGLWSLTEFIY